MPLAEYLKINYVNDFTVNCEPMWHNLKYFDSSSVHLLENAEAEVQIHPNLPFPASFRSLPPQLWTCTFVNAASSFRAVLTFVFSNLTRLEFGPAGTHLHTLLYHMSKWTYCDQNGNRTHRSIRSMHVATTSTWSPALSKKVWTFNFLQEHPHHIGRQFMAEAIRLSVGVSRFIFLGIGTAVLHWHRLTCRCWTWDKDNTTHVTKKNVDLKWFGELTGSTC